MTARARRPLAPVTAAEYRDQVAREMAEATLLARVIDIGASTGWRSYHTHDSRRSQSGYPDLTMVNARQRRTLFAELKRHGKKPTDAQEAWIADLRAAGQEVYVWWPADLVADRILAVLTTPPLGGRWATTDPALAADLDRQATALDQVFPHRTLGGNP